MDFTERDNRNMDRIEPKDSVLEVDQLINVGVVRSESKQILD